ASVDAHANSPECRRPCPAASVLGGLSHRSESTDIGGSPPTDRQGGACPCPAPPSTPQWIPYVRGGLLSSARTLSGPAQHPRHECPSCATPSPARSRLERHHRTGYRALQRLRHSPVPLSRSDAIRLACRSMCMRSRIRVTS